MMMVTERYLGSSFTGLRLCFLEGLNQAGYRVGKQRSRVSSQSRVSSSSFFAFQVHNVHGAFNALEGADKLSSNRGYSWALQLSATLCRRAGRAIHETLLYPVYFICLFSQNHPDTAG